MTREEAFKELGGTWRFTEVGGKIALREVALIEAVAAREAETACARPAAPPQPASVPARA